MDSMIRTIAHNERINIEGQLRNAFDEVSDEDLEGLTKRFGELRLCFEIVKKTGSPRHLKYLIPRLIEKTEAEYKIHIELSNEYKEALKKI